MKTIKVTLNGFHGCETRSVRAEIEKNPIYTGIPEQDYYSGAEEFTATLTESAARKFSCRMSDCTCGEGLPLEFGMSADEVKNKRVEIPGNYPQRS